MNDADTLQQRTQYKLSRVQETYSYEVKQFDKVKKEARALAKQLALSERVTELGNLVALSRKTIDRENRWLDSVFDTTSKLSSYDFDIEVERAKRIVELKNKIMILRNERGL